MHTCAIWSGPLMSATQIVDIPLIPLAEYLRGQVFSWGGSPILT